VPGSRRHADPPRLLLSDQHWHEARAAFVQAVDRPVNGAERLRALAGEQAELLERLSAVRDAEADARLEDGGLVVDTAATAGDLDEGRLGKLIEPRLPEIDLAELLIDVDGWASFTQHLVPLSGNRSRSSELPCVLYAVIVAQATNLGLTGRARASQFSYQQLEWAWEQYCREPTLTAASASLVDYHHALPLAQAWGTGQLSSSDGQRFSSPTRGPRRRRCRDTWGTAARPGDLLVDL
jgi:Tn3 transposase DDE domain